MVRRQHSRIETAFAFLASTPREEGAHRPSLRALAARAGVSATTMRMALIAHRRGISCGEPQPSLGATVTGPLWMRVREDLRTGLLTGHYRTGDAMPSTKELCVRYRANYRTVRKALDALCREGMLSPAGRGYLAKPVARRPGSSWICLVALADSSGNPIWGNLEANYYRLIEAECSNAGVGIRFLTFTAGEGGPVLRDQSHGKVLTGRDLHDALGSIYVVAHSAGFDEAVLRFLGAAHKPVAVMYVTDAPEALRPILCRPTFSDVKVFAVDIGIHAATVVAQYLLDSGRRRAAFFSPYHRLPFSREVLRGLEAAFAAAGPGAGLQSYVRDVCFDDYPGTSNRGYDAHGILGLQRRGVTRQLRDGPVGNLADGIAAKLDMTLHWEFQRHAIGRALEPFFEEVLADPGVTAWIGPDDLTGLLALEFLRTRGIEVPRRIGVISFDDTVQAFADRLTSYNYNFERTIAAVLAHVLKRGKQGAWAREKIVTVPGFIVRRETA